MLSGEKEARFPSSDFRVLETRNSKPIHSSRHRWYVVASVLLAVVLLYFAFRRVNWRELWATIRQARAGWLVLACAMSSATYLVRAMRWRILLATEKPLPVVTVFWANMAGYMGNNFLPARAGEVIRSAALGARTGLSRSFVLATALTERVLDAVALVLISLLATFVSGTRAGPLVTAFKVIGIAGLAGLGFVIAAPRLEPGLTHRIQRLPFSERIRRRGADTLTRFLLGMRTFQTPARILGFAGLTAIIWVGDGLGTMAGVRALHLTLSLPQALMLLAGLGLSSAIPSTPGYIGVFQFIAVTILMPFGFSRSQALAYSLVAQFLSYVLVAGWGLVGLWRLNIRGAAAGTPPGVDDAEKSAGIPGPRLTIE